MPKTSRAPDPTGDHAAIASPRFHADRMYRAAQECVRQRQRYATLVERALSDDEQHDALRIASICDEALAGSIAAYTEAAASNTAHRDEEWWHKANGLWHAAREYGRRHAGVDADARRKAQRSPTRLAEMAVDFDLEASALLALRHAIVAYGKVVTDADL